MSTLDVELIPALSDNYIHLIHAPATGTTGVVDPAEAGPVLAALERRGLKLDFILNTHHHPDHVGGNLALKAATGATIVGPTADAARIPGIDVQLGDGDSWRFGDQPVKVFDVPGHTRGHIAFWFPDGQAVFVGDTLFSLGCGRLFEGTPEQMQVSLSKLAALPPDTRVYCAHEYTQSNARFALSVEPHNAALRRRSAEVDRLRAEGKSTIPSTIGLELETNPFLRWASPEIQQSVGLLGGLPAAVLGETRRRKDNFR